MGVKFKEMAKNGPPKKCKKMTKKWQKKWPKEPTSAGDPQAPPPRAEGVPRTN